MRGALKGDFVMKTARTLRLVVQLRLNVLAVSSGAAALVSCLAPLAAGALLPACADENDPQTWVKRLDDPAQRPAAIKRLSQFFDDATTKANKNLDDPQVKQVVDAVVDPMSKVYTTVTLDEKTRMDLIKILADMRDPRAAPAFAKAFNDYEPGKNDEDVKSAAQAVINMAKQGKLTDQGVIDALWNCFSKFQASKTKSINLVTDLHDAVLAVKSPSYGPKAVEKLAAGVDPKIPEQARDQIQFWQLTSIQVISDLKYTQGVHALVTVVVNPSKRDLRSTANAALMRMPKEAEPALISALKGTDPDFAKYAAMYDDKSYIAVVADSLSWLSRPAGKAAILEALAAADNDQNRTILAQSLVHYPPDATLVKAFLDAYAKIPATAAIALLNGANAHGQLTQAASQFFQPSLTEWLVKEISTAKGEAADEMQLYALDAAIKLMQTNQLNAVREQVNKEGTELEKSKYKLAAQVVQKCNADVNCYVKVLDEPIPSSPPTAAETAVKAAWMAGEYGVGNASVRSALVDKVEKVQQPGARLALVEAIDFLAPQGDPAAADKLEKLVDADRATGDKSLLMGDDGVVKVALRLRARAMP
jgi:hypothetical protein